MNYKILWLKRDEGECTHAGRSVQQQKQQSQKKPGEENAYFYERMTSELAQYNRKEKKEEEDESWVMWSSRAMIESVEEVCRDISWGEKREIGRIGLALQDHICRDLIEEIVTDLGCYCFYTLPFEACKRRLSFWILILNKFLSSFSPYISVSSWLLLPLIIRSILCI